MKGKSPSRKKESATSSSSLKDKSKPRNKKRDEREPNIGGMRVGDVVKGPVKEVLAEQDSNRLAATLRIRGCDILLEDVPDEIIVGNMVAVKLIRRLKRMWLGQFIRIVEAEIFNVGVFKAEDHAIHSVHRKRSFSPIPCSETFPHQTLVIFEEKNGIAIIKEVLGSLDSPKTYSKLAAVNHDVWVPVTQEEEDFCASMDVPPLGKREDLRHIPLVTIDGFDARDFDDAVYAKKDTDPNNPGGYKLLVAIADVAHYVKAGDTLDAAASQRGNSVYFPDYVLPMLPERLSNDLCSLRPNVDRACVACHITISKNGKMKSFHFTRALMQSHARLTYEEVEKALIHGKPNKNTKDVLESTLLPLFEVYKVLRAARDERGALNIESDEHKILFDENGEVKDVSLEKVLTSHQIIEECMVLANVASAKSLSQAGWPCMYRIHDKPDPVRLQNIKALLSVLKLPTLPSDRASQKELNAVLKSAKDSGYAHMISQLILRSQSQAQYSPTNIGHFGLNLSDYAHFTSPIRRYSDLVLHRILIEKHKLEEIPETEKNIEPNLGEIAGHISKTERRASAAEREAGERFMARYLSHHVGEVFEGTIVGAMSAGLFISIDNLHAEGFLPKRLLMEAHNAHSSYFDMAMHMLRVGKVMYHMGLKIKVKLLDADPMTCEVTFAPVFEKSKKKEETRGKKKSFKKETPKKIVDKVEGKKKRKTKGER